MKTAGPPTYTNPVYPRACPDPYVLKHAGEYWCYSSGLRPDGRAFSILHSLDLVHWREVGGALDRLGPNVLSVPDTCYWAPEVVYDNGRFYMYYSAGNEAHMQIRVAVAAHPAGPFADSGRRLTRESFAIDAHVFIDDDGPHYLFYATDYLTHTHVGTGTAVDRLLDPLTLGGQPRPVTRARYDWQVYDPQRGERGGVRWHTLEGPFVLKRKGRYYQMFSGGNWRDATYGVSYATSSAVTPDDEWQQGCDGVQVLPILRTLSEAGIIGPGHNSVVRGPANRELFCMYHGWQPEAAPGGTRGPTAAGERVLAIDRLEWLGEQLIVFGPTTNPQPAPIAPALAGFGPESDEDLGRPWEAAGGHWSVRQGRATQTAAASAATARLLLPAPSFLVEVTLAGLLRPPPSSPGASRSGKGEPEHQGEIGLSLHAIPPGTGEALRFSLDSGERRISVAAGPAAQHYALPTSFDFAADHLLRLEVDGRRTRLVLDGVLLSWRGELPQPAGTLALFTRGIGASFAGFELTTGWESDFSEEGIDPSALGWQSAQGDGHWVITERQLRQTRPNVAQSLIVKGAPLGECEVVINVRLERVGPAAEPTTLEALTGEALTGYGLCPAFVEGKDTGPLVTVEQRAGAWHLVARIAGAPGEAVFPLPAAFDPFTYQQFRFRVADGQIALQLGAAPLGAVPAPARRGAVGGRVGLCTFNAVAAFDLVRVTALSGV